jgi:hypothetical protein
LIRQIQRRRRRHAAGTPLPHALQNRLHVKAGFGSALLDCPLHPFASVLLQQLQNANVMLASVARSVLPLKGSPQLVKHGGQFPAAKDVGMNQRRRPTIQPVQIVLGIEDLLMATVRAWMRRDHLVTQHHVEVLDVHLDGHGLEGGLTGDAVAVGVIADHLVFIDLGRLENTGIEGSSREGQCLVTLHGKALADALCLAGLDTLPIT